MEILDTNNNMIKYLKGIVVIIYFKYKFKDFLRHEENPP